MVHPGFASAWPTLTPRGGTTVTASMRVGRRGSNVSLGTVNVNVASLPGVARPGLTVICASTGRAAASAMTAAALEAQVARNNHALDFVRSLTDLEDLLITVQTRDGRLLHEPVPAVDLERVVDDPVRELAGEELRHRRLLSELAALVLQPRRLVDRAPRRL